MVEMDLRTREIADWRKRARTLMTKLVELEEIADVNDSLLLTLHQLALLLIQKRGNWRKDAEQLLKKRLSLLSCEWRVFDADDAEFAKTCAALPIGGKTTTTPLIKLKGASGAKSYFYLPIRKSRKTLGVLMFAARKKDAFAEDGDYDFTRRLAALLAVAL